MAEDGDGFFSRWSRRKAHTRQDAAPPAPPAPPQPLAAATTTAAPPAPAADRPPTPTLDDALRLTPQSDFRPFVARGVAPEVRNTALRQLFTDPHFQVMDGLDVYIDDYSQPSPLPAALARQMASAQFLGLFDEKPTPGAEGDNLSQPSVAQSGTAHAHPPLHETSPAATDPALAGDAAEAAAHDPHADLQLQPDPAPERVGSRRGPG